MTKHIPLGDIDRSMQRKRVTLPLAPPLEMRRLQIYLALMLADAMCIVIAAGVSGATVGNAYNQQHSMLHAQLLVPVYWTAALALQVYNLGALLRPHLARLRASMALLAAETVLLYIGFVTKRTDDYSRASTLVALLVCLVLLLTVRSVFKPLIEARCGRSGVNLLVIDDGGSPVQVPNAYHINASEHHLTPDLSNPHMMDRIGLYMTNMDRVLVTCPPDRRAAWALVLKSANIMGEIVDAEVAQLGVLGARRERGYGALVVASGPLGVRARASKRLLDLTLAGSAVLFLAPLLAVVALLIKLEDRGPVFFIQQRTGRGNRFFPIFKFRSMRVAQLDSTGARSAAKDDDRITRIGRFIRSTSIDELPQLFNVLRGEMSIVGPRPHAIGSLAGNKLFWEVDNRYWLRHSLKPGLTGLAQVRGLRGATDSESDLALRLQADLEYLDGWTIWRDILIIVNTVRVVVHDRAF